MSKNPNNPFAGGVRNFQRGEKDKTSKELAWGTVKFNPIAKDAKVEPATPWAKFKDELLEKERETKNANSVNMDSKNAKEMLKRREQNYRKMLITEKSKGPTKWETFSDDEDGKKGNKKNTKKRNKNKNIKKAKHQNNRTLGPKSIIPQEKLINFDSKKLSAEENLTLVKILNKTTASYRTSLDIAVDDLKHNKIKAPIK